MKSLKCLIRCEKGKKHKSNANGEGRKKYIREKKREEKHRKKTKVDIARNA